MLPRLLPELRIAFERVSYGVDEVPELLGDAAHVALGRNESVVRHGLPLSVEWVA